MGMIKSEFLEQILESVEEELATHKSIALAREEKTGRVSVVFGVHTHQFMSWGDSPLALLFGFIEESADMGQGDILSFGGDKENIRVFIRRDDQEIEYSKDDILGWASGEDSPTGE